MRLITLTTDFGTRDPYVAQLKAELHRRGPSLLQVIDLSHEIEPQNVREAALFVAAALPRFPAGTIHLVVIDPGVGSERRPVCVRAGEQLLIGPDNGVFSRLYDGAVQAALLEPARLGLPPPSATFHGRDLFAPAAAALAGGLPLLELGAEVDPASLVRLPWSEPQRRGDTWFGEVIHVDRFGNLSCNLERSRLTGRPVQAQFRGHALPLRNHYAEVEPGALLALWDSAGRLEVAARDASAARITGGTLGDPVSLDVDSDPASARALI